MRRHLQSLLALIGSALFSMAVHAQPAEVSVYAAGSLRSALAELA
jgi:ABC-type molybdate transport system substrate-binding protein